MTCNLVSDGYEVASAYTCSAAKGLLKNNYNLALLDINLPDGNYFFDMASTKTATQHEAEMKTKQDVSANN